MTTPAKRISISRPFGTPGKRNNTLKTHPNRLVGREGERYQALFKRYRRQA